MLCRSVTLREDVLAFPMESQSNKAVSQDNFDHVAQPVCPCLLIIDVCSQGASASPRQVLCPPDE